MPPTVGALPRIPSGQNQKKKNLCLSIRAETSSLTCGTGLKVPPTVGILNRAETSSLTCGTGLKVPPTVGILLRMPHGQNKTKKGR